MSGLLSEEDEVVDSGNGNGRSDGGVKKPFRKEAERAYLVANNQCWHCVTPVGINSSDCEMCPGVTQCQHRLLATK